MPDSFFLKGLIVALVFGVPAGTIGALTIQHTLQRGFKAGVITGLGSTAADIFYACVGMCGISFGIAIMNPTTILSFMVAFALVKIPATATILQECGKPHFSRDLSLINNSETKHKQNKNISNLHSVIKTECRFFYEG